MTTRDKSAFAIPIIMLAACGGGGSTDIEATLRFADRDDTEIARLLSASTGAEIQQAQGLLNQYGNTPADDPCPTIAISGTTATVTGGCTTADGTMIGGTAIVTNSFFWDQFEDLVEFGDDATYEMIDWSYTYMGGITQRYSGLIEVAGDFTSTDGDITTEQFGVQVRSDIYTSCGGSASSVTCNVSGSGVELVGVGGAKVSGTLRATQTSNVADYTLRGEDTMTVHIEMGCVAWEIEGTDRRQVCAP